MHLYDTTMKIIWRIWVGHGLMEVVSVNKVAAVPGAVPVPGKPVYVPQANAIYVFSFSKNTQSDNKLSVIDLKQSFNTLKPPVSDISSQITNNQCPVIHFATAMIDADGVSVNIFGAGSNINGVFESTMTTCQYNTQSNSWKQIITPINAPLARRNAAFENTHTNLTYVLLSSAHTGGSSEAITGLSASSSFYPNYWHQDVAIYDSKSSQWLNTGLTYGSGPTRANATLTQISDTNGQLVVVGGAVINNSSQPDMVTNFPLANMSDIIVLDPRSSRWTNIVATGDAIPPPRKHHTTTLHPDGHTLIVIGGEYFNDSGAYLLNDVWTLDTRDMSSYTWSQPPIQGVGLYRSNHTSILIGDQIWVIAGTNTSAKAVDIQLLNVTDWTWSFQSVSTYTPPEEKNIGTLVGTIVGVVGAVLLIGLCAGLWWCRRKRIRPFSKEKKSNSLPIPYGDEHGSYDDEHSQQMQSSKGHRTSQDTSAVLATSKITSHPSMSTTTSNNNIVNDWNNQQTMTGHPPNINTGVNYYNNGSNNNGGPYSSTPNRSSPDRNQPQYYETNYFTDGNNNVYSEQHNYSTGFIGANLDNPHQRQSFGYWDTPPPQFPTDGYQIDNNHNIMLTPMGRGDESGRPIAPPSKQRLQKPNELDDNNNNPLTSPDASATVYTSSTGDDDRTTTQGNYAGSDDPLVHNSNNKSRDNTNT
ncbi:hypothetical protein [Parasitella parasitica]|uniref:Galactose oxidase n=1 Tax=Parasitella parasitica TaxID=35722 RepID=A0A0B7NNL4_9FUNG|nr:hypothetical protein [Parasitella parasitica]